MWFINQYNVSPITMGQTPPEGKGKLLQGYVQFEVECDLV
jgi:hypothetical protein